MSPSSGNEMGIKKYNYMRRAAPTMPASPYKADILIGISADILSIRGRSRSSPALVIPPAKTIISGSKILIRLSIPADRYPK